MRPVAFIDTSVLCNLLEVPTKDQEAERLKLELKEKTDAGYVFILPVTAVIETGNHIAHLGDGRSRRAAAERFAEVLRLVQTGRSPWVVHEHAWNATFLGSLLDGADTGVNFVEHATRSLGAGDLCILAERAAYHERAGIRAEIWSIDRDLIAYSS